MKVWNRLVGSDPGLARLQMGLRAAIAVGSTFGIEFAFGKLMHSAGKGMIVGMLLGAIVSMMGTMALSATTGRLAKVRTASGFPVAIGIGLVTGVAVSHNTDLMLSVFVVVMFVAVAIRRFGPPFFFYGFMGWMGYFFSSFLGATMSTLPALLLAVLAASAWITVLSTTILRTNPARTLRRALWAYRARARVFAGVCSELLRTQAGPERNRQLRRLHATHIQLSEAALIVEGWSGEITSLPTGRSGLDVRRYMIDAEYALDGLASSTKRLLDGQAEVVEAAAMAVEFLALRDDESACRQADEVTQIALRIGRQAAYSRASDKDKETVSRCVAADQLAQATVELAGLKVMSVLDEPDGGQVSLTGEFEPVVGLFMGNLPGSPAITGDVPARGVGWNPLARLSLPMRQAIQVGVAGGVSILAGRALSPERYYWAVIASFIMFAGTATRTETFLKGFHRVIGTLAGLVAAVWVADLTVGHRNWVVGVIVICIFFGLYLFRVSYAYMIFFLTIILGQLYSILHEFTTGLLLLRLEETVIGAAVGFIAALVVVPLSTRDTIRTARNNLLSEVAAFLRQAGTRIADHSVTAQDLEALSRTVDNRLQQLVLLSRPLTRPFIGGSSHVVHHRLACYASLTTDARALAVALRLPMTANRDVMKAEFQTLSTETERLTASPPTAVIHQEIDRELFAPTEIQLEDSMTASLTRVLLHLQQVLNDLRRNPGDPL